MDIGAQVELCRRVASKSRWALGNGGLAFSRSSLTRCCLTIASEGRETWAAGSLRGFGVGFGFWRELEAWSGGRVREETTDGHVSRIHRAFKGLALERREAGWGGFIFEADVFGTRQEYSGILRLSGRETLRFGGFAEVTSRD
jgi:hypothetical protein